MDIKTGYDRLNNERIVGMYYKFLTDIFNGTLSDVMFNEVDLLESIAAKRGFTLSYYRFREHMNRPSQLIILIRFH
ncbi:hypothetical protein J0K78_07515 [Halobacillus sp. GSS1]|uniref:hypothetical protein n=1 Tax=Halobacillus sp. GSS1 TaxID=2815919 RepID=UPI001A8E3BFF|nr:hypothetical protein [Halobacillus sp. GSS1]MBN9654107.1 hypothetical protein [Halobacillus sp. GSS1]